MRTLAPVVFLALGVAAVPIPVDAQQSGKVARIGWLSYGSMTAPQAVEILGPLFWSWVSSCLRHSANEDSPLRSSTLS